MGKRLIPQRRARGGSHYRSPSHRHVDDIRIPHYEAEGTIKDLIQAPGRTSPLAVIDFEGKKSYQLAVEGTRVGQKISLGGEVVKAGNILTLANIPEGTLVHNVEGQPGDGGKFVKTAGTSALVVSRGKVVVLTMPSGELKEFNPNCRAVIGVVAGGGRLPDPEVQVRRKQEDQGSCNERSRPPQWRRKPPARRRPQLPWKERTSGTESRIHCA